MGGILQRPNLPVRRIGDLNFGLHGAKLEWLSALKVVVRE